jgi:hypothetical protein
MKFGASSWLVIFCPPTLHFPGGGGSDPLSSKMDRAGLSVVPPFGVLPERLCLLLCTELFFCVHQTTCRHFFSVFLGPKGHICNHRYMNYILNIGEMMLISVGNTSYLDTINLMLLLPTVRAARQLLYSPGNGCLCFTPCCKSVCRCLYKHGFYDEVVISKFETHNWWRNEYRDGKMNRKAKWENV